jgi:phosphopantetheinyl transferase (holo-ACP synthase)
MIGNDVIDIAQSRHESNWQRKGFIQKLFTTNEQLLIAHSPEPEIMVWALWSMKEAAYKIYNRQTKIREYSPQKLVCSIISQYENCILGQVICCGYVYHTKTMVSKDSIHSIAVVNLHDLNKVIEIERKEIFKDNNGIPYLHDTVSNTFTDVSLSHHGRFEKVVTLK